MNRHKQWFIFTGIGLLTLAALILLISPNFIFSSAITVIGGDPNKATTDQVSVTTLTDLGNPEQLASFPYDLDKWHGMDYDSAPYIELLKAKAVLIRGYNPETFTQPLFLVIVQGTSDSAIHEPHYCFPNIQEQAKEELLITDPKWTKGQSEVSIPLNKLVSAPTNKNGQIYERRVVLYFYVKGNQFYSDNLALVEVQGLAPLKGSYEGTLKEEKAFLSQVVPLLFQPSSNSEWRPLVKTMAEKGFPGYIFIILIILIPLIVILLPWLRRRGSKS